MIYTLTLNPSLDYHIDMDRLTQGCVNRAGGERIRPGGKGINVSMVLKNLGVDSVALGFWGGFAGEELRRLLEERGIHSEFVRLAGQNTRINVKIHAEEDTDINADGPDVTEDDLLCLMEKLAALGNGDLLVLSGNVPRSVPETVYGDIIKEVSAKNVKVIVDATGRLLAETLSHRPFLIKPNIHELSELYGEKMEEEDRRKRIEFAVRYGRKLKEAGARNVLVSLDKDGAVLIDENHVVYEEDAPEGVLVNSVGAGDSVIAGFLAEFLKSGDYKKALRFGVCAGSASAFSEELASTENVKALMERT